MPDNQIHNGDFNDGESHWDFSAQNGTDVETRDEEQIVKNSFCHIASTQSIWQVVSVAEGDEVTVAIDHRGNTGVIEVLHQDSEQNFWSKKLPFSPTEWKHSEFTFTAGKEFNGQRLRLHIHSDYNDQERALNVDNISFITK